MLNKKVILCLVILSAIVLILGLHGGSEYYFRDFCVHKALNMFYHNGSPDFFKKPGFVSDIEAIAYAIFYFFLKKSHLVNNFDEFVKYFSTNYIPTPKGNISFMTPALIINNIFAVIGVCFTFLTTYLLTNKKIFPAFLSGFILATSNIWMSLSHHLAVDIPLAALCITTIYFSLYFIQKKEKYTRKDIFILGILTGLCTATKYNGLLVFAIPLFILFCTQKNKRDLFYDFLLMLMGLFAAFYITNPYMFLDFGTAGGDFSTEFEHAFANGHLASDSYKPILFHLFHSFPNALGLLTYFCSLIGLILFIKNRNISIKMKIAFLSFPFLFIMMLSFSNLIFLRYTLPIIPIMTVFAGYMFYCLLENKRYNEFKKSILYIFIVALISFGTVNAIDFYNIAGTKDTRVLVKEIFKTIKLSKDDKVMYTDIFSNPYYNEDFLGKYPKLKDDIIKYLYGTNYTSIFVVPGAKKNMFNDYSILIMDSGIFDRYIQVRLDGKYQNIENQYFMYFPKSRRRAIFQYPENRLYVIQINPYKIDKSMVPFGILVNDHKYRAQKGPFVEIYFKDQMLRDEFAKKCIGYSQQCDCLDMEQGYYYKNYLE